MSEPESAGPHLLPDLLGRLPAKTVLGKVGLSVWERDLAR